MYRQDLPSIYLYVEESLKEEAAAAATDSHSPGHELITIRLF
jgi:hypothetical protein